MAEPGIICGEFIEHNLKIVFANKYTELVEKEFYTGIRAELKRSFVRYFIQAFSMAYGFSCFWKVLDLNDSFINGPTENGNSEYQSSIFTKFI